MTTRPLLFLIPIILLATASAQDFNSFTEEEMGDYISAIVAQQQVAQQQQQPVVVQIKTDASLNQKIDLVIAQLGELKNTDDRLQEKFVILATDIDNKLEASEKKTVSLLTDQIVGNLASSKKEIKDYVREQTNPVRMNLPSIGVLLMASALFLIMISRTYNFRGKVVSLGKTKPEKKEEKPKEEKKEEPKKEEPKEEKKKRFGLFRRKSKEEKAETPAGDFEAVAREILNSSLSPKEKRQVIELYKEGVKKNA